MQSKKLNILVIGSGGREHALAWKLKQSPRVQKLFIAPGNAGTQNLGQNVSILATDISGLVAFTTENKIDLTVVGSDDPLALGIVDAFQGKGLRIWGPTKAAAQIEASKVFAKELMATAHIPTASFQTFSDYEKALAFLEHHDIPVVVKASGLALGKGVFVCQSREEAHTALQQIMVEKAYGDAGREVVIEDYLDGPEVSIHAFSDGKTSILLPSAQDHKTIFDGDQGPNTGGMGTIAPVPWVTGQMLGTAKKTIVDPALAELAQRGSPFVGLLYPGLKMTSSGPKVLEFNARFGDPETQSYMRLLKTDLVDIFDACIDGTLDHETIEWHPGFACCVVLASGGYPGVYQKGLPISGIDEAEKLREVVVFHAGTVFDGGLKTSGGRVLGVTATGNALKEALNKAYDAVGLIHFDGMQYRRDIGKK